MRPQRRRRGWHWAGLVALALTVACSSSPALPSAPASAPAARAGASTGTPTPGGGSATPAATAPGPRGLTLDEEIGAVMMVGFRGRLTPEVLADWRRRQFGGLLVVNLNGNAYSAAEMRGLIAQIRGAVRRRLVAATDQEGGAVCLAIATVPCLAMPVSEAGTVTMATGLRELGFDLDLGPVADVCDGPTSVMWGRCYGTDPSLVAAAVAAVVDGIHAAHMLAAAKHFPGHGGTAVSSERYLPRIDETLSTLAARDWPPFEAAIAHGADFVLLGHLYYPALDPLRSADLSPATVARLRSQLGFRGAIISDDMEMGAITDTTPAPEAAVEYLAAGGDMVMIAHDLSVADATYDAIRAAVLSGRLARSRLDQAVQSLQAVAQR